MERIYKVTSADKIHLVQAHSQAQALRHVAGKYYAVKAATAIEVAQMMSSGVALEDSTGGDQQELDV